ncbi:phosphoribosyl pyrophosphokinase [Suhomyces tanzawaensis NRRL Y-17324]|uniref:ribose-phosphate diphosphokinase n=1 Tax=Suhomyces tanzawaensis NRRL Y-17324 TaxID=984487 RepID=A0A1E4SR75_9ASCO|nr:phosphoribosyl pyrophosphokinase [Suhomyces tanzawaensis NRRL Y-17324]ODV81998.1 phosphoribosyl pyrophosphokinase [Suhomyces tanzawaensis NRRL Y-17324]
MRDLIVLGGSSHPALTKMICKNLTIEQGQVLSKKFSNGETSIEVKGSVREKDVFIIQSGCGNVNDNFIELLIMIAACKTASARRVTAVLPLFPYSRQPDIPHMASVTGAPSISTKKDQYTYESRPGTPKPLSSFNGPRDPSLTRPDSSGLITPLLRGRDLKDPFREITPRDSLVPVGTPVDARGKTESGYKQWIAQNGTLIANLLTTAGADRMITMDLHDPQFQGFFNIPVDNLYLKPLLKHYLIDYVPNYQECVIVSPDSGGAKRATSLADALGCSFALIHKERRIKTTEGVKAIGPLGVTSGLSAVNHHPSPGTHTTVSMLVGDVKDRTCVLIDDLVDTSYTITRAAKLLKDQGAKYVYALVTHGVFSGDAINRVSKSAIDKVITTNSVPQNDNLAGLGDKLEVLDVSRVFAESIRRIHNGESVSMLFDHGW